MPVRAGGVAVLWALLALNGVTLVGGYQVPVLTPALAFPLVLWAPGYALLLLLELAPRPTLLQEFGLSVGLSLSTLALGALLLNDLPGGINRTSWYLLITVVSVVASGLAVARRGVGPAPQLEKVLRLRPGWNLAFAASAATPPVLAAAVGVAFLGAANQHWAGFTEFWLVPRTVSVDGEHLEVGIVDEQGRRLVATVTVYMGKKLLYRSPAVHLAEGGRWTAVFSVGHPSPQLQVVARLTGVAGATRVDRTATWWPPPRGQP